MVEGGTYALVAGLKKSCNLRIGKLGIYDFPVGYYVYAGSALNGLSSRLKRHLRIKKRLHWHIDYLLQKADIEEIWYTMGNERLECAWNRIIAGLPNARPIVRGFGSSDCRCHSHLTHFITEPQFATFSEMVCNSKLSHPLRWNIF